MQLKAQIEGYSQMGQPILSWAVPSFSSAQSAKAPSPSLLVMGAVHGDEVESIWLVNHLIKTLNGGPAEPTKTLAERDAIDRLKTLNLSIAPCLNPDGGTLNQRWNANNVDLNRNLPTKNWQAKATDPRYPPGPAPASEPETKVFLEMVKRLSPRVVVSVHSYSKSLLLLPETPVLTEKSFGASVVAAANEYARAVNVPVVNKMDYTIFGSLSGFASDNGFVGITLELLRGLSRDEVIARYWPPFAQFLSALGRE